MSSIQKSVASSVQNDYQFECKLQGMRNLVKALFIAQSQNKDKLLYTQLPREFIVTMKTAPTNKSHLVY